MLAIYFLIFATAIFPSHGPGFHQRSSNIKGWQRCSTRVASETKDQEILLKRACSQLFCRKAQDDLKVSFKIYNLNGRAVGTGTAYVVWSQEKSRERRHKETKVFSDGCLIKIRDAYVNGLTPP